MLGRLPILGRFPAPLAYRAATAFGNASDASKPAGVATGDLVVVLVSGGGTVTLTTANGGGAWSRSELTTGAGTNLFFWKVLTATDVAETWTFSAASQSGSSFAWSNGGEAISSVTVKTSSNTAGTGDATLTLSGFAPGGGGRARAAISGLVDENTSGTVTISGAGFTLRSDGTIAYRRCADWLIGYDGQSITWAGLEGSGSASGWLVEVL